MYYVASLLVEIINIYSWIVIVYILLSWVPNIRQGPFGQFLGRIVEPYLAPFRKIIPPIGMIDISPIVAIIVLRLAERGIYQLAFILG